MQVSAKCIIKYYVRKTLLALLFLLCVFPYSCTEITKNEQSFYFVCSGKFYNYESAFDLASVVKIRGGSGFVYENRAYFVCVSMHSSQDTAKSVLANMPKNYFLQSITLPDFCDETMQNVFENLDEFLLKDLFVEEIDFSSYLISLKTKLQICQNFLDESKYLYLKADFFVICSLIDKNQNAEHTAKYLQAQLFFNLYHFITQL